MTKILNFPNIVKDIESSSCIKDVKYLKSKSLLMITFESMETYVYINVKWDTYNRFINAKSKGKFYNKYIKGQTKRYKVFKPRNKEAA